MTVSPADGGRTHRGYRGGNLGEPVPAAWVVGITRVPDSTRSRRPRLFGHGPRRTGTVSDVQQGSPVVSHDLPRVSTRP